MVTPSRYQHSLRVEEEARRLALRFGANEEVCALAGLLHDCARDLPHEELLAQARALSQAKVDTRLSDPVLLHGIVGAHLAMESFGVCDSRVLQAIGLHTTGGVSMSREDKVVCLADYTEPGRAFPGVESIRRAAQEDLDTALLLGFDCTIRHLINTGRQIDPSTVLARNALLASVESKGYQRCQLRKAGGESE
jgi:predicted HD superfamily hydrolase involved in NAD metabolism